MVKRIISSILIATFLATNTDLALALSPPSRLQPIARIVERKDGTYDVAVNKEEVSRLTGDLQRDTVFLVLNHVMGDALLLQLGESGLKELFKKSLPHQIDLEKFKDEFDYSRIYKKDGSFYLPYKRRDTGKELLLRYFLLKGDEKFPDVTKIGIAEGKEIGLEVIGKVDKRYRSLLLKDASVDKDYFELLFKANLDLIVLAKKRMAAKGDAKAYEEVLEEIRSLVKTIEASIDAFKKRKSKYGAIALTSEYREEAKQHVDNALRMIERGNEQAANLALWAALSDIECDRIEVFDLLRNVARVELRVHKLYKKNKVSKKMEPLYQMHLHYYKKLEGALTTMRVGGWRTFRLIWQAFASCDHQIDFELLDRVVMKDMTRRLDGVLDMVEKRRVKKAENLCRAMLEELGTAKQVEEKRLGIIALGAAAELLELGDVDSARDLLTMARRFFNTRFENAKVIVESIQTGRLGTLRDLAIARNRMIIKEFVNPILEAKDLKSANKLLGRATNEFMREPEFRTLMPLVWKSIIDIRGRKDSEVTSRNVKDLMEKLAWRVRASNALGKFMEEYRDRLARRCLDEVVDHRLIEEELFRSTFQDFLKKPGMIRGSPDLFWTISYQPAFVPLEIDDPENPPERISNPLFEAIDALILIKLVDNFVALTKARNFPKQHPETNLLLGRFLELGKNNFAKLDEDDRRLLFMALVKDYGLDALEAIHLEASMSPGEFKGGPRKASEKARKYWKETLPEIAREDKHKEVLQASRAGVLDGIVPEKTRPRRKKSLTREEVLDVEWQEGAACDVKFKQYIGTLKAVVCTVVILYDHENKIGSVLHLLPIADTGVSINKAVAQLEKLGAKRENLKASIFNGSGPSDMKGYKAGEYDIYKVYKSLSSFRIPVVEKDILGNDFLDLVLDLNTGEVFDWDVVKETPSLASHQVKDATSPFGGRPRRRSDGTESKWDIFERFVEQLNALDITVLAEAERIMNIGDKRNLLLTHGIKEAEEIDASYLVSAIEKAFDRRKSETKQPTRPVVWTELLSYAGVGRYLICYKDADPVDGLVVKMPKDEATLRYADLYSLNGAKVAMDRLGGGLAAECTIIDARKSGKPFVFYIENRGRTTEPVVIVQEKILPLVEHLKRIGRKGCEEKDVKKAIEYVDRLKQLVINMYKRGVVDNDIFNIVGNYGIRSSDDNIVIFDLGELSNSERDAASFMKDIDSYNELLFESFSEIDGVELDPRIANHFLESPFKKEDFIKDGTDLFGCEYDPERSRMKFPYTEEELRALFARQSLHEKDPEDPFGLAAADMLFDADKAREPTAEELIYLTGIIERYGFPEEAIARTSFAIVYDIPSGAVIKAAGNKFIVYLREEELSAILRGRASEAERQKFEYFTLPHELDHTFTGAKGGILFECDAVLRTLERLSNLDDKTFVNICIENHHINSLLAALYIDVTGAHPREKLKRALANRTSAAKAIMEMFAAFDVRTKLEIELNGGIDVLLNKFSAELPAPAGDGFIQSGQGEAPKELERIRKEDRGKLSPVKIPNFDEIRKYIEMRINNYEKEVNEKGEEWERKKLAEVLSQSRDALARFIKLYEAGKIFLFKAIVYGKEDYALGYGNDDEMGVAEELLGIDMKLVAEYLFHEAVCFKTKHHDAINLQFTIFGNYTDTDRTRTFHLKEVLRALINRLARTKNGIDYGSVVKDALQGFKDITPLFTDGTDYQAAQHSNMVSSWKWKVDDIFKSGKTFILYGQFGAILSLTTYYKRSDERQKGSGKIAVNAKNGLVGVWDVPEGLNEIIKNLMRGKKETVLLDIVPFEILADLYTRGYPGVDKMLVNLVGGEKRLCSLEEFKEVLETFNLRRKEYERITQGEQTGKFDEKALEAYLIEQHLARDKYYAEIESVYKLIEILPPETVQEYVRACLLYKGIEVENFDEIFGNELRYISKLLMILLNIYFDERNTSDEDNRIRDILVERFNETLKESRREVISKIYSIFDEKNLNRTYKVMDLLLRLKFVEEGLDTLIFGIGHAHYRREVMAAYTLLSAVLFGVKEHSIYSSRDAMAPALRTMASETSGVYYYLREIENIRKKGGLTSGDANRKILYETTALDNFANAPGIGGHTWFTSLRDRVHRKSSADDLEVIKKALYYLKERDASIVEGSGDGLVASIPEGLPTAYSDLVNNLLKKLYAEGRISSLEKDKFLEEILKIPEAETIAALKEANPGAEERDIEKVEHMIGLYYALSECYSVVGATIIPAIKDVGKSWPEEQEKNIVAFMRPDYDQLVSVIDSGDHRAMLSAVAKCRTAIQHHLLFDKIEKIDDKQALMELDFNMYIIGKEMMVRTLEDIQRCKTLTDLKSYAGDLVSMGRFLSASGLGGVDFEQFLNELEKGELKYSQVHDLTRALRTELHKITRNLNRDMRFAMEHIWDNVGVYDLSDEWQKRIKTEIRKDKHGNEEPYPTEEGKREAEDYIIDGMVRESGIFAFDDALTKFNDIFQAGLTSDNDAAIRNATKPKKIKVDEQFFRFGQPNVIPREKLLSLWSKKGLNLVKMTEEDIPVPPGVILSAKLITKPNIFKSEPFRKKVEREIGLIRKHSKYPDLKLLLYARSGSAFMLPGLLVTIPNLGMNDKEAKDLARLTGDAWFAYDTYAEFIRSYAINVLGIAEEHFQKVLNVYEKDSLTGEGMKRVCEQYKDIVKVNGRGQDIPDGITDQVMMAIATVYASWNSEGAIEYRRRHRISQEWGTVVILQKGVFGNLSPTKDNLISGTGVAALRVLPDGREAVQGKFRFRAIGDQLMSRADQNYVLLSRSEKISEKEQCLEELQPVIYKEILDYAHRLEEIFGNNQLFEFTVELNKAWITQSNDDLIKDDYPEFVDLAENKVIGRGHGVSGGALRGWAANSFESAEKLLAKFKAEKPAGVDGIILFLNRVNPELVNRIPKGVHVVAKIISVHAETLAQKYGITALYGVSEMRFDEKEGVWYIGDNKISDGTTISIDGHENQLLYHNSGKIFLGSVPIATPRTAEVKPSAPAENAVRVRQEFERDAKVLGGKGAWCRKLEELSGKIGFKAVPSVYITIQEAWSKFIAANSGETNPQLLTFPDESGSLVASRVKDMAGEIIYRSSGIWEDSFIRNLAGVFISVRKKDNSLAVQAVKEIFKQALDIILAKEKKVEGVPSVATAEEGIGVVVQPFLNFDAAGTANSNLYGYTSIEAVVGDAKTAVQPIHANMVQFLFKKGETDFEYNPSFLKMPYQIILKGKEYCAEDDEEEMTKVINGYPKIGGKFSPITAEQAKELNRVVSALEKEIGVPLDVEWGFLKGELHITQIRPIIGDFKKPPVEIGERLKEKKPIAQTPIALGQTAPEGFSAPMVLIGNGVDNITVSEFEAEFGREYIRVQHDIATAFGMAGVTTKAKVLIDPSQGSREAHNINLIMGRIAKGEFTYANGPALKDGLLRGLDFIPHPKYKGIWISRQDVTYFSDGLKASFYIKDDAPSSSASKIELETRQDALDRFNISVKNLWFKKINDDVFLNLLTNFRYGAGYSGDTEGLLLDIRHSGSRDLDLIRSRFITGVYTGATLDSINYELGLLEEALSFPLYPAEWESGLMGQLKNVLSIKYLKERLAQKETLKPFSVKTPEEYKVIILDPYDLRKNLEKELKDKAGTKVTRLGLKALWDALSDDRRICMSKLNLSRFGTDISLFYAHVNEWYDYEELISFLSKLRTINPDCLIIIEGRIFDETLKEILDRFQRHYGKIGISKIEADKEQLSANALLKVIEEDMVRWQQRKAEGAAAQSQGPSQPQKPQYPQKLRLLWIDPDENVRSKVSRILNKVGEDYEYSLAKDGTEALKLIGESRFDLVIYDLRLPDFNKELKDAILRAQFSLLCSGEFDSGFIKKALGDELFKRSYVREFGVPFSENEVMDRLKDFRLRQLEAYEKALAAWQAAQPQEHPAKAKPEHPRKLKVLFFDNDKDLIEDMPLKWRDDFGEAEFEFSSCRTYTEALQRIKTGGIDLLIFDCKVPYYREEEIRDEFDKTIASIPFVFIVSGLTERRIREELKERLVPEFVNRATLIEKGSFDWITIDSKIKACRQQQIESYREMLKTWYKEHPEAPRPQKSEQLNVLFVSDNPSLITHSSILFGKNAEAKIECVSCVKDAIEHLKTKRVDLLIADFALPIEKEEEVVVSGDGKKMGVKTKGAKSYTKTRDGFEPIGLLLNAARETRKINNYPSSVIVFSPVMDEGRQNYLNTSYADLKVDPFRFMAFDEDLEELSSKVRGAYQSLLEDFYRQDAAWQAAQPQKEKAETKNAAEIPSVLVLGNDSGEAEMLAKWIKVQTATRFETISATLAKGSLLLMEDKLRGKNPPAIVVTDQFFNGEDRLQEVMDYIMKRNPDARFVITSEEAGLLSREQFKGVQILGFAEKPFYFKRVAELVKFATEDETLIARDANAKPEPSAPASGIKVLILNGERIEDKANMKKRLHELTKERFIFTASIYDDTMEIGILPRTRHHDDIEHPKFAADVIGGEITENGEISLVVGLRSVPPVSEEVRIDKDEFIRFARFCIENGISDNYRFNDSALISEITRNFFKEMTLFEVIPSTLGELARQPLSSESNASELTSNPVRVQKPPAPAESAAPRSDDAHRVSPNRMAPASVAVAEPLQHDYIITPEFKEEVARKIVQQAEKSGDVWAIYDLHRFLIGKAGLGDNLIERIRQINGLLNHFMDKGRFEVLTTEDKEDIFEIAVGLLEKTGGEESAAEPATETQTPPESDKSSDQKEVEQTVTAFLDTVKLCAQGERAKEKKALKENREECRNILVGIEVQNEEPNYVKNLVKSAKDAVENLVRRDIINNGLTVNVKVVWGNSETLHTRIAEENKAFNAPPGNIVLLGREKTLIESGQFDELKGKAFLACFDPKDSPDYLKIAIVALEFAFGGKSDSAEKYQITVEVLTKFGSRIFRFKPMEPVDANEQGTLFKLQTNQLNIQA